MKVKKLGPNMTELQYADGLRVLMTYETPVAAYVPKELQGKVYQYGYVKSEQFHSRMTSKHVGQWLGGADAVRIPQAFLLGLVEVR